MDKVEGTIAKCNAGIELTKERLLELKKNPDRPDTSTERRGTLDDGELEEPSG